MCAGRGTLAARVGMCYTSQQGGAGRGESLHSAPFLASRLLMRRRSPNMAIRNSNSASTGADPIDNDGAKDASAGQSDDAVGAANATAGARPGAPVDALDNGNSGPTPGSLDANLAAQRDADARAKLNEAQSKRDPNEPVRVQMVSGATPSAPTPNLDRTIPGGKTVRADGVLQNAHGLEIDEEGTILDTPHNRSADPRRFSGIPQ